jgi:hypothetical protein
MLIKISESRLEDIMADREMGLGFCTACGEEQYGCEPDAREYECECCGKRKVFGVEELVLMGQVIIVADNEEGEEDGS